MRVATITESVHLKGEKYHLLLADVVLIGQQEVWYKIYCNRKCHPDEVHFTLTLVGDGHSKIPDYVHVHFGPATFDIALDQDRNATWKAPANTILDPKSKRIFRPILLSF